MTENHESSKDNELSNAVTQAAEHELIQLEEKSGRDVRKGIAVWHFVLTAKILTSSIKRFVTKSHVPMQSHKSSTYFLI